MTAKVIAVYGATGNQGGSVVRSLLKNYNEFSVRAITRNPASEKSRNFQSLGAEIVQADGWNSESMIRAFHGTYGIFVNMNSDDFVS